MQQQIEARIEEFEDFYKKNFDDYRMPFFEKQKLRLSKLLNTYIDPSLLVEHSEYGNEQIMEQYVNTQVNYNLGVSPMKQASNRKEERKGDSLSKGRVDTAPVMPMKSSAGKGQQDFTKSPMSQQQQFTNTARNGGFNGTFNDTRVESSTRDSPSRRQDFSPKRKPDFYGTGTASFQQKEVPAKESLYGKPNVGSNKGSPTSKKMTQSPNPDDAVFLIPMNKAEYELYMSAKLRKNA